MNAYYSIRFSVMRGAYPCRCVSADRIGKMERHSGTEYIGEGNERKRGRLIPLGL